MKHLLLLMLTILCTEYLIAQKSDFKNFQDSLIGKSWEQRIWTISKMEIRELGEEGPVGNFKETDPNEYNIGKLMANSGLPDSISFKKSYQFETGLFNAKFWHSSSNENHSYKVLSGLCKIQKNKLIWDSPDDGRLENVILENTGADFFVLKGEVPYGSEAFEYFEYRVTYRLKKNEN
jgi:hypothetical protein